MLILGLSVHQQPEVMKTCFILLNMTDLISTLNFITFSPSFERDSPVTFGVFKHFWKIYMIYSLLIDEF